MELAEAMEQELSVKWTKRRGISVVAVGINTIAAIPEDEERIKQLQLTAVMRDPNMRLANAAMWQGDVMKAAASNEGGAMVGFANLNMAQNAMGGMGMGNIYDNSQPYQQPANAYQVTAPAASMPQQPAAPAADTWKCPNCGNENTGKFCMECGTPKPAPAGTWVCPNCGYENTGKFCMECGAKKPAEEWTCSCGNVNPMSAKFCQECGSPRPQ
jgi:membrane protease subunit (stomatin/prohibitin family)